MPKIVLNQKKQDNNLTKKLEDAIAKNFQDKTPDINALLRFCTENKCSDLYIKVGERPVISRYGIIYTVPCFPLTTKLWQDWAKFAISSENNAKYVRQKMLDFSYSIPSDPSYDGSDTSGIFESDVIDYRYRVSAGFSLGKNIATFRMISQNLPSFSTINFPKELEDILREVGKKRNKITIFVGVTGSGKTTTMAACMHDFSQPGGPFNNSVIISLEDPIEYIYPSTLNVNVLQKELGTDFKDFSLGVKQALREHPNFINVGETRDKETINTLVEASRTGHAVFTSFHASDVGDTISRLYNYLIGDNESIMYDLIANLNLIICQRLIPTDSGFNLNTQYMVFTDQIIKFLNRKIEEGKNIPTVINGLFQNPELLKYNIVKDWD